MLRRFITGFVFAVMLTGVAAAGPFEDGVAAYQRGDYVEAVKLIRPAAEQGRADAQHSLGFMYEKGQGVPQDDAEAVKWYRLAADQGDAEAQVNLGLMYERGQPPDGHSSPIDRRSPLV